MHVSHAVAARDSQFLWSPTAWARPYHGRLRVGVAARRLRSRASPGAIGMSDTSRAREAVFTLEPGRAPEHVGGVLPPRCEALLVGRARPRARQTGRLAGGRRPQAPASSCAASSRCGASAASMQSVAMLDRHHRADRFLPRAPSRRSSGPLTRTRHRASSRTRPSRVIDAVLAPRRVALCRWAPAPLRPRTASSATRRPPDLRRLLAGRDVLLLRRAAIRSLDEEEDWSSPTSATNYPAIPRRRGAPLPATPDREQADRGVRLGLRAAGAAARKGRCACSEYGPPARRAGCSRPR